MRQTGRRDLDFAALQPDDAPTLGLDPIKRLMSRHSFRRSKRARLNCGLSGRVLGRVMLNKRRPGRRQTRIEDGSQAQQKGTQALDCGPSDIRQRLGVNNSHASSRGGLLANRGGQIAGKPTCFRRVSGGRIYRAMRVVEAIEHVLGRRPEPFRLVCLGLAALCLRIASDARRVLDLPAPKFGVAIRDGFAEKPAIIVVNRFCCLHEILLFSNCD